MGGNRDYATALGELIVAWNQLEQHLKLFIPTYEGSPFLFALAAEMGVSAYTAALTVLANDGLQKDVGARLLECLAAAGTLREHRNYLVHNSLALIGAARPDATPPEASSDGLVQYIAAKRNLTMIREQLHPSHLDEITNQIKLLREAVTNALAVALWDKIPSGDRPPLHPMRSQPQKLVKSAQHLQWHQQQPTSV